MIGVALHAIIVEPKPFSLIYNYRNRNCHRNKLSELTVFLPEWLMVHRDEQGR